MAENIFETPNISTPQEPQEENVLKDAEQVTTTNDVTEDLPQEEPRGSQENAYSSRNAINVSIIDSKAPLVVLFGPPTCGKTMTLVRLTRFLHRQGYTVAPIRGFRPSDDLKYQAFCDGFDEMINSDDAATGTGVYEFMLIEVMKNGKRVCQLLEAPGESYFDPEAPNAPFPNFLNNIMARQNRKLWVIMVEPNYKSASTRKSYVTKVGELRKRARHTDKNLILFNKIDITNFVISPGHVHTKSAVNEIRDLYPGLIEMFRNTHPITSLWRSYNCGFIPFQTGYYSHTEGNHFTFQEGPDEYVARFWQYIKKSIGA